MRSVRVLLVLSLMSIIGFVFVVSMFVTPTTPQVYQQNVVGLDPKCEVVKKGNQFQVTFSWNPNGSKSYVLYIFNPVGYKQAVYDPNVTSYFAYQLVNSRGFWQAVVDTNPYWKKGRIEGYIEGKRNGVADFICTPPQNSGDEKPTSLPTPTKPLVPVNDINNNPTMNDVGGGGNQINTFPPSSQTQIKVGDLNNNGQAFDRGDVVCAIIKYLSNQGKAYQFPDPNQEYVYNIDTRDNEFNRKDVVKMVVEYLRDSKIGSGSCLDINIQVNDNSDTTIRGGGGGTEPTTYNTLKGVGYCHWNPGLNDKIIWFYQSSTPAVWWGYLNPADDVYNVEPLIKYLEDVDKNSPPGSKVLVELYLAGVSRNGERKYPQWVIDKGAIYVPRGDDGTFVPWNPVFKQELQDFLAAVNRAFIEAWGDNLEKKPKSFEGIVIWAGGYYGEMQIWWPTNRSLWERYGSEKLGISPFNSVFKQKFNELWTESAIELASIYARTFHPKIRLMFQMGNGLYANIFNWQGPYFQSQTATTDLAAAMEIVHRFPNRFYFKFNGWVAGMPSRKQWEMFQIKQTRKALGVGYEVGHGVVDARWMVDYVLGINDTNPNDDYQGPTGIPNLKVDYVCIQPVFMNQFGNQLDRLIQELNP